jgi:pyruvate dehydrogenase E1 component alpha subunit
MAELWRQGLISGEMHLGIGEEGIIAGVVDHLEEGDAVATDHRSTAPMVMHGVDLGAIVAECLGSTAGLGRGMGGHMHLMAKEHLAAASGIVGACGPMACGFALAHQHLRPDRVAIAFFGEGAMNQGMLLESLNLAAVWSLPVVFVCRDNGMAITTPSRRVTAGNLPDRVRGFGIPAAEVNGSDAEAVWELAGEAVLRARRGGGPGYLHASCVRPEGHMMGDALVRIVRHPVAELKDRVGPLVGAAVSGTGAGVGSRLAGLASITGMMARAAGMRGRDPLTKHRGQLERMALSVVEIEQEVEREVDEAVAAAVASLEEVPA